MLNAPSDSIIQQYEQFWFKKVLQLSRKRGEKNVYQYISRRT